MKNESELVRRAREGDRAAFGELVRSEQRGVFAVAVRIVGNREDAEDVVQDTFVRAWKSLRQFDETRSVGPWLRTIAVNRALTLVGARQRRGTEELTDTHPWSGPSPQDDAERRERDRRIRVALDSLPEEQRAVLALRAGEDLSYEEIAAALGIPIGTVMSRLARAREAMRRRMKQ